MVAVILEAVDGSGVMDLGSGLPVTMVFVLSAFILTAAIATAVLLSVSRRRRKDGQEIILLLEEMRSGKARGRLDVDPRSPFAPIAESANRLAQDLAVRWSRAETANEGFFALQEAARGYAVIATDADGDLRSLSPGAAALFGWEEEAVIGRNASLLFDEGAWKDLLPKLARKSLRERGVETRALMARHDGSRFHARLLVRMLRGHGDEASGFLLVIQDINEQVKTEAGLKAAESRSRGILEQLPGGVALVADGRMVYANSTMRALLHLTEREADGFALRERIATTHVLIVQDALARIARDEGDPSAEAVVTLLDAHGRSDRDVRFIAVPHPYEGRTAALVLLRDETSERRLHRIVAAQEARLDAVLDAWEDAVVLVEGDPAGARVRLANRAFIERFDLRPGEINRVTESELVETLRSRGIEGAAAAACLLGAIDGPTGDAVTTEDRALILRAAPLEGEGPVLPMRMLVVRDVTDDYAVQRVKTEEVEQWKSRHDSAVAAYAALKTLHDELEKRVADADALNAELRTLDGMKSDLLANVSHELQTPLVSIRGYTEMTLKGRLGAINEEQKKGLTLSLKNIDRLIAMIDNLLAFARADRDTSTLSISTFPLLPLIDEALALLTPRIDQHGLHVTRKVDDATISVRADRDKILQVFLNLVGNAVKFNREGGSIEVSARRGKPGFALIQVADTGIGIAKDDLERVFDRFYRAPEGNQPPSEGSGIGLAIVRNILRLHGCVIHATSEPGEGTVLSFTLPLAGEKAVPAAPVTPDPVSEPSESAPVISEPAARAPAARDQRPRLRIIRRR